MPSAGSEDFQKAEGMAGPRERVTGGMKVEKSAALRVQQRACLKAAVLAASSAVEMAVLTVVLTDATQVCEWAVLKGKM